MEYKKMEKKQLEIENFLTVVPFKKYNYSTILIIFYFFYFEQFDQRRKGYLWKMVLWAEIRGCWEILYKSEIDKTAKLWGSTF